MNRTQKQAFVEGFQSKVVDAPLLMLADFRGATVEESDGFRRKLEKAGIITGYHAMVDGRKLGLDITAFVGVGLNFPRDIQSIEAGVVALPGVLECHHVTGGHTLLIKVKARNTERLEALISRLRCLEGVQGTHTMVVLSTQTERVAVPLDAELATRKGRRRKR